MDKKAIENMEKTRDSLKKQEVIAHPASLSSGATTRASSSEADKIGEMANSMDKDERNIAAKAAKETADIEADKHKEEPAEEAYTKEKLKTAVPEIKQEGADYKVSDSLKNSLSENTKAIDKLTDDQMTEYMSQVTNDMYNTDISNEQGNANAREYISDYSSIINDSDAMHKWASDWKKANFLTAISKGIEAMTGVPGIDFTQSPSIEAAKKQIDEAEKYLNDIRSNANKRQQELLDTSKQVKTQKIANKKEELDKVTDSELSVGQTDAAARRLAQLALEQQNANDKYLMNLGTRANKELSKQDDLRKNMKSNQVLIQDTAKKAVDGLVGGLLGGI